MHVKPGVASLFLLVALGIPGAVQAQLVSPDDPCYKKLSALGLGRVVIEAKWSESEQLGWVLLGVRRFAESALLRAQRSQAQVAAGKPLSAGELSALKEINDCIPWLIALASRLDDELRKRGMNSIVASLEDQRRARAEEQARAREAQDRARVAQETADALAKAVALLRIILPR
jgi:hypothetical protein